MFSSFDDLQCEDINGVCHEDWLEVAEVDADDFARESAFRDMLECMLAESGLAKLERIRKYLRGDLRRAMFADDFGTARDVMDADQICLDSEFCCRSLIAELTRRNR